VTANGDGGDAITGFTATCTSSDGGTTRAASNASSPITVGSLTNGSTYTCVVVATNTVGGSAASGASDPFVALGVAAAPTITSVDLGLDGIVVGFTANADGGDAVTGFTVTCASSDGGTTQSNADASSPVTVSTLDNGNTYTCVVVATNSFGDSVASDATSPFVAGGAPSAPSVTGVIRGSNSAMVAFTSNGDGGDAIIDYRVTCTSTNGGISRAKTGLSSPVTVASLSNGRTYACKVVASNSIASSLASGASGAFVAATNPSAPTLVGVTRGGDSAIAAFTANADGGAAVTGFTVSCASSDGGATQSASGASSPVTVGSLTNSKTYTCTVVATNAIGDSAASSASSSFVAANHPPAPGVTGVTLGSNSAMVAFTSNGNAGDAITAYTATCVSSDGGASQSASGASSPVTVGSLTNSKTYTCTVVATNGFGDSAGSVASSSFVAGNVPDAPTLTGLTRGSNTAIAAFTANGSGGSAITTFTVTCTSGDGGTTRTMTGATSPLTVTSLTNAGTYTCTVFATNAFGNGAASSASASFVAATSPPAPTITGVTRGNNSGIVAFTANGDAGDAITAYTVACSSTNGGATQSASGASSPITVASLTNGKTYSCTVLATNGFGNSPASVASALFVVAATPSAPSISTLTHTPGSAVVSFTAGATGGSAITSYTVTCTSSNGGATATATSTRSPITVTGLTTAKLYSCRVTATSAIGTSAPSIQFSFTD
jgi:titin